MKFTFSLFFVCSIAFGLSVTAEAQQVATTSDGKRVQLNADGTWKYAPANKPEAGVALKLEAGLVYQTGPQPLARVTFALLDADPTSELMALPRSPTNATGIEQLAFSCRTQRPEAVAVIEKNTRYKLTTGFDGRAELAAIKPGKYWLVGVATTRRGCALWLMPVDLTKHQSLTLDQNNAAWAL